MKVCTTCGREWSDDHKFCPDDGSSLRSVGGTQQLVGSVIAERYHIEKKLGEGGMGAVYLAEHVKMGRKSAIKVMAQAMANDPDAIARFNREAANAARINHPNVCAIYDFGETPDGLIYLAMEFIEGEALTDLIEREGALPAGRAARILRQAGEALQTAHDMGIVHRDLKPDNIMISRARGGEDVVKVVDFGIAKAMSGEEGQQVTKTGLVVGTPEYMSPEQLSGDRLDGRSDIYSLALVLFHMLTGALPFEADSAQEVMIKRLTDEPTRLNDAKPGANFPPRLQEVLDKALQRMPGDRYASAAAFARDVEEAVRGMPAPASADAEGATVLMDAREASAAAQAAKTEQLATTRVAGEPVPPPSRRAPTPDTARPQPSPVAAAPARKAPVGAIAAAVIGLAVVGGGAAVMLSGGGEENGAPPDTSQRAPGAVTNGTARDSAGDQGSPDGQRGERNTPPAPDTGRTTPPAPPIDSAGVDAELEGMIDAIVDPSLRPEAIRRARAIFDDMRMPAYLREIAAATAAAAYVQENDTTQACRWYGLALDLLPPSRRDKYDRVRTPLRCP